MQEVKDCLDSLFKSKYNLICLKSHNKSTKTLKHKKYR